jgi:branched-chain amino acid transport system permease protein
LASIQCSTRGSSQAKEFPVEKPRRGRPSGYAAEACTLVVTLMSTPWLDIIIPVDRLITALAATLCVAALYIFLRATNIGRAVVAVRMDRRAAQLMGVDVERTYALTFGLGAAFAGVAGALLSIIFPISPLTSPVLLGKSFVICIIGGLGSVPGVLAGGVILGLTESFGASLFGAEHSLTISFGLLLLLLIFRPTGLFGKRAFQ